jgi:hypothetical protein
MGKHFAQQARSHLLRRRLKEAAGKQAAGHSRGAIQTPVLIRAAGSGSWSPTHSPGKRRMDGARSIRGESRRNS